MISTSSRSLAQPFNMAPKNNSMAEMNAYTAAWLDRCADEAAAARAEDTMPLTELVAAVQLLMLESSFIYI